MTADVHLGRELSRFDARTKRFVTVFVVHALRINERRKERRGLEHPIVALKVEPRKTRQYKSSCCNDLNLSTLDCLPIKCKLMGRKIPPELFGQTSIAALFIVHHQRIIQELSRILRITFRTIPLCTYSIVQFQQQIHKVHLPQVGLSFLYACRG